MNITDFIKKYSSDTDEVLNELERETHIKCLMPSMLSGRVQAKILEQLSRMIRPDRILEIGSFTGYSAICLAKGLSQNGELHTYEINDELEGIIRKYIKKSGNEKRIKLHIGDFLHEKEKPEVYDFAFIDGDKRQYLDYYKKVMKMLKPGNYLLIDNIFWHNKVLEPEKHTDDYTRGILDFLDYAKQDPNAETVVLPLRDGLMLIRKTGG